MKLMPIHKIIFIFIVFPVIISFSCAMYKPFIAPSFTGSQLTEGGLAVFPALVAEGRQSVPGVQGYVHAAGEELASSLKEAQPSLKVITPSQVSAALASSDLVADFSRLKQDYSMTGMVDINLAKK